MTNPLLNDRDVEFILYDLLGVDELCRLPYFSEHSRETFDLYLASSRKLAREKLFPAYRPMDEHAPKLESGRIEVHSAMKELLPHMVELGVVNATRPHEVDGQQLPFVVFTMANAYLMAANLSAYGYLGLTSGAARLIESFGTDELKQRYMVPMYDGSWTGTMALTEPHAGSSLTDVTTQATPTTEGHYLISGTKIFISGGEHDLTDNIVHLTLARIKDAPPGIKGVSLFAIPKKRFSGAELVSNDAIATGLFHKIGWRGLPSIALTFGDAEDCHGYLVGKPNQGIRHMFQMMNEARLMIGMNAAATASVAYQESLEYARTRPQGRRWSDRDPSKPQVNIIEHADVRRMLLRQKAIVEGSFALIATAAQYMDVAERDPDQAKSERARLLLELLTPVAKSFPAERGFEANTLAVQVHGGYGYTSEYLPEAWWRDQKLNSIHEGTTGIHSIDLLGRKVMMRGGEAMRLLHEEIGRDLERARAAGVEEDWCNKLQGALAATASITMHLGSIGASGDVEGMLLHSVDYLDLFGTVVIGWMWLAMAACAKEALAQEKLPTELYEGKLCCAQYWINTELPRVGYLAALCRSGEDSYDRIEPTWF